MASLRCLGQFFTNPARFLFFTRTHHGRSVHGQAAHKFHVPVLIVGGGPAGLTLSILLSKLGVRSVVVERMSKLPQHPQAHFINNRTMEIFRVMDGLAEEIMALQPPLHHWRRFVYCTTLSGPVLGTVDHLQPSDVELIRSPESVVHFSQHRLLPLLYNRAVSLSDACNDVSPSGVMLGYKCESFEVAENGVFAKISSVKECSEQVHFQAQYLVAADGANSHARETMGVKMEGAESMQHLISVHFFSKELGQHLLDTKPGMLYFVFNPSVVAVLVAHDLQLGEFVFQIPIYPPQQSLEDFSHKVCKKIIQSAAGIANLAVDVRAVKQWTMHAQVAEKFIDGDDRVFLVGDAAHRFPPAGGFGMNTSIQDAHNLAWKLALVLHGSAPPSLLRTYELERRPVALANTALSVANFRAAMAIPSALGLNPSTAKMVHTVINTVIPRSIQSTIMDSVFAIGRSQVSPAFLSQFNPIASARLARVQQILDEGRSLQLQFPAEDLGFRYTDGAIVPELSEADSVLSKKLLGRREEYVPSSMPGARLPHMNISLIDQGSEDGSKNICSTLDLLSVEKEEFLLIVGPNESGWRWAAGALETADILRLSLKIVFIEPPGSPRQQHDARFFSKKSEKWNHQSSVLKAEAVDKSWWDLCGIPDAGALLVRPDGHIAWRSKVEATSNPAHDFQQIFARILSQNEPALEVGEKCTNVCEIVQDGSGM